MRVVLAGTKESEMILKFVVTSEQLDDLHDFLGSVRNNPTINDGELIEPIAQILTSKSTNHRNDFGLPTYIVEVKVREFLHFRGSCITAVNRSLIIDILDTIKRFPEDSEEYKSVPNQFPCLVMKTD